MEHLKHSSCLATFDVGGTKTDALLFTETGEILSRIVAPGGPPLDLGMEDAVRHYKEVLLRLFEKADAEIVTLYGSVAATEYYGDGIRNRLIEDLPGVGNIRIEGDGPCLISGMLGHTDGAGLICGTGSSLYIREGEAYRHIGGWGHLIDSCGSGYVLARNAIQSACRAHDGRNAPTLLSELLQRKCGVPIWEHFDALYRGGRAYIASFAEVVFAGRKEGDREAIRIFNEGAADLANLVHVARKELKKPFTTVLNGGIFRHFPEYASAVCALCPDDVELICSDVPPSYGGAVEAMYDIGRSCDSDFRARFLASYNRAGTSGI